MGALLAADVPMGGAERCFTRVRLSICGLVPLAPSTDTHVNDRGKAMFDLRLLLLLPLLISLAGCSSVSERKKENALDSTLSQYRVAMRWGRWDTLVGFRAAKAPEMPQLDFDNIRVTAYEVRQPPVPVGEGVVAQVVEIHYVLNDLQRLRKLYDKQEWRHDEETLQWTLYSPFPEFR